MTDSPSPQQVKDSDIAWLCSLKEDGHCGEGTLELSMRTARNDRIDRILSALAGPSPPDPQQVKEAVERLTYAANAGFEVYCAGSIVSGVAVRATDLASILSALSTSSARVVELEGEPTDEMAKAGMPWLEHYHHMRAGDKRNAVKNAFRAMITVARSALHPEGKPDV